MAVFKRTTDRIWESLATIFPRGKRRGYEAQLRLATAYKNIFAANSEDAKIVLADLANESGYYRVSLSDNTSTEQLWQQEGKRVLFARIFEHLTLQEADLQALETAARRESATDYDELIGN